jgi:hypothetical protein
VEKDVSCVEDDSEPDDDDETKVADVGDPDEDDTPVTGSAKEVPEILRVEMLLEVTGVGDDEMGTDDLGAVEKVYPPWLVVTRLAVPVLDDVSLGNALLVKMIEADDVVGIVPDMEPGPVVGRVEAVLERVLVKLLDPVLALEEPTLDNDEGDIDD